MIGVFVILSAWPSRAQAQDGHDHLAASAQYEQSPEQKRQAGALVRAVRDATERFQNPAAAERHQYFLNFGCVSGGDFGAMGLHFVNIESGEGRRDRRHARPRSCSTSRCRTDACD